MPVVELTTGTIDSQDTGGDGPGLVLLAGDHPERVAWHG
jgi:hypothetical protein